MAEGVKERVDVEPKKADLRPQKKSKRKTLSMAELRKMLAPTLIGTLLVAVVVAAIGWEWPEYLGIGILVGVVAVVAWSAFLYFISTIEIDIDIDFSDMFKNEPLECDIRTVIRILSSPAERYEFLAKTIAFGECKGEKVVLGSPIYIAFAPFSPVRD